MSYQLDKLIKESAELIEASLEGDIKSAQKIIAENIIYVNCKCYKKNHYLWRPRYEQFEGWTPLIFAAFFGHTEIVQLLLSQPSIEINYKVLHHDHSYTYFTQGFTALIVAAFRGHKEIVQILLSQPSIDINCKDDYGWTPLIFAAYKGHTEIVQLLLSKPNIEINCKSTKTDINSNLCGYNEYRRHSQGVTALIVAASEGHKEIVQILLSQPNIDINCKDDNGWTPLIFGANNSRIEVVQLLLSNPNIEINCKSTEKWDWYNPYKHSPYSKENRYSYFIKGWTPLIYAIYNDCTEIVKLLVSQPDIEINSKDDYSMTPLLYAVFYGNTEIVQLLLSKPNIEIDCISHYTTNYHAIDWEGWTPLIFAVYGGHTEIVQLLLSQPGIEINHKARINKCNYYTINRWETTQWIKTDTHLEGWTPLIFAVTSSHTEIVQLLLSQPGIEVNCKDNKGWTPLIFAVNNGKIEIVQLLLSQPGIEINCKATGSYESCEGWTPLIFAVSGGHTKIVQLLLSRPDIKINYEDRNKKHFALDYAKRIQHKEIIELLTNAMNQIIKPVQTSIQESEGVNPNSSHKEEEKSDTEEKIRQLESDKEQLTNTIGQLESDKEQLTNTIGQLKSDNEQLTNRIDQLKSDNEQLTNKVNQLIKDHNDQISSVNDQISQMKMIIEMLMKKNAESA